MNRRPVLTVVLRLPSPTALTFFAGLFAGAGINLLTSMATGESSVDARIVALDSIVWVVAAAFLTSAAQRLDSAQRRAAGYSTDPNLSEEEKLSLQENQLDQVAGTITVLVGLTVACVILAIALLPRLSH